MQFLNAITPAFLKKLDRYLLLNHRLIWETKFHYVVFFGLVALLSSYTIGHLYPVSFSMSLPNPWLFGGIFIIPAFLLMCFWVYKQYQYSIEGQFGHTFKGLGLGRFAVYTASIMFFILPPLQLSNILDNRIAGLVTESELKEDLMKLNIGNPYFPTNNGSYEQSAYSIEPGNYNGDAHDNINVYLDCMSKSNVEDAYCNSYGFNHFWVGYNEASESEIMAAYEHEGRWEEFFRSNNDKQHLAYIKDYLVTFHKYGAMGDPSAEEILANFHNKVILPEGFYAQKQYVASQLNSISEAQSPIKAKNLAVITRVSLLLVLGLSLLLTTLKSVSLRDFIISAVSLIAVGIGSVMSTILFDEFVGRNSGSTEFYFVGLSVSIYGFTLFNVFKVNSLTSFSRFKTICMVALNLVTPFIILWAVLAADMLDILKMSTLESLISYSGSRDEILVANLIIAGAMLHLFVVQPWLRGKFLRMQSLPRS